MIISVWEFFQNLLNPKSIVALGVPLLLFVIFAETGLFFGFFLPGDSLVFITGLYTSTHQELIHMSFYPLAGLMILSAVLGNIVGYLFGRRVGRNLFKREDSLLFKKRHLIATENFYNKYGPQTLVLGRFLPYVRTFAPILAGIIKMDFKYFLMYNILGAVAWITSISGLGYFLGSRYPWLENYLGYIVITFILITTIPVVIMYFKNRPKK